MSSKKCLKGKSYGVYACLRHHEGMKIFIIDIGTRNVIAEADKYENAVSIMFKKGRETGRKVAMLREDHRVEEDLVLMEKF